MMHLSTWISLWRLFAMAAHYRLYQCLSACLFISLSIWLFVYLSVCLCCRFVVHRGSTCCCIGACLFVCLSICLLVYLSVCLRCRSVVHRRSTCGSHWCLLPFWLCSQRHFCSNGVDLCLWSCTGQLYALSLCVCMILWRTKKQSDQLQDIHCCLCRTSEDLGTYSMSLGHYDTTTYYIISQDRAVLFCMPFSFKNFVTKRFLWRWQCFLSILSM